MKKVFNKIINEEIDNIYQINEKLILKFFFISYCFKKIHISNKIYIGKAIMLKRKFIYLCTDDL